ncbi:unnamed protein product [Staurois parvus]|uniref:Secreted protein n=1 Tax=Staurois parvus TaxID=386267 RepID=A0ABN9AEN2_9NEOB|nr:unnamed protein product [Staurois parvus]
MGPLYRLLMLLPGPESLNGSLYGLPLLLSPSPHSAMCHFQVSSHCWCVPFCHRVAVWPPIAVSCLHRPHCGSKHMVLAP